MKRFAKRVTVAAGCLALTGATLLAGAGGAGASEGTAAASAHAAIPGKPAKVRDVPTELAVPAGNERTAVLDARGVQTYTCTDGAWTLLEPAATLWKQGDPARRAVALHSRGPVWVSTDDGSAVNAAAVANVPRDGAIPQLLLKATTHRGTGLFADVSYIQRLETRGGLAPAGACATDAGQVSVGYSATYVFYAPEA